MEEYEWLLEGDNYCRIQPIGEVAVAIDSDLGSLIIRLFLHETYDGDY